MNRLATALLILLFVVGTEAAPTEGRMQKAQASFERVATVKLSELSSHPIDDGDYQEFVSSLWCTRTDNGGKEVLYIFWGFNTQNNTVSMCNIEMPTFVRPDLNQLELEWDKDEDGNLKSGSWMSGYTFIRQRNRIDIFAGSDISGDIVHIVKTTEGWAIVADGPHEPIMFLTRTGKRERPQQGVAGYPPQGVGPPER